jgi:biopolymer transport protein ExbD
VSFKHLVTGAGAGASRASNIALNLTPFVDMMTILVTFLLMVFSSTGELLQAQKGLELAHSENNSPLQKAPVIIVSKTEITYQGQMISTVQSVLDDKSPTMRIDALFERLESAAKKIRDDVENKRGLDKSQRVACEEYKAGKRPVQDPKKLITLCPEGLAIVQADKTTDALVINKVVHTAKQAGFDNLLFAVNNKK